MADKNISFIPVGGTGGSANAAGNNFEIQKKELGRESSMLKYDVSRNFPEPSSRGTTP